MTILILILILLCSESYLGISTYYINDVGLPWWRVFDVMEEARNQFPIEDYSVTQTTLEQVFLQFTRLQGNAEADTSLKRNEP